MLETPNNYGFHSWRVLKVISGSQYQCCVKQHCIGNWSRTVYGFILGRSTCLFNYFQVLPLATEVVRWFDMKPLEILWDKYLSREHTLLCYGSCIALRYSILHAGRLMHFLEQPPPSWKVRSLLCTTYLVWVFCFVKREPLTTLCEGAVALSVDSSLFWFCITQLSNFLKKRFPCYSSATLICSEFYFVDLTVLCD